MSNIEIPVGTRIKVSVYGEIITVESVEAESECCTQCALSGDERVCRQLECRSSYRTDGKWVMFKKVKGGKE